MRIKQLHKPTLITESWNDPRLTLLEERVIIPFIADVERYIVEAKLSPEQISQIFTSVEQGATAAGGNRTAIGKGADAATFIADKMKELKAAVANSGPVQNIDQKFEELKQKIGQEDSKVVSAVKSVSDWAKENPGKASIAVAVLTVAAGMAGGPLAGAITGFISRATKDLLKGESLSSAVGSSLKTAAIGAIVGVVADNIEIGSQNVEGGTNEVSIETDSDAVVDKATAEVGADSEAGAQISSDPENAEEVVFGEISEEAYRAQYAEKILNMQLEKFGGEFNQDMMNKIADNIVISGEYPDDFRAQFSGTFVRGNIYLTIEEANALENFTNNNDPFGPRGILGAETTEWMKENVEGASEVFDAQAAAQAAKDAELADKYNAMSAEEQQAYDEKRKDVLANIGEDPEDYTPPGEPKYGAGESTASTADAETTGKKYSSEEAAQAAAKNAEKWGGYASKAVVDNGDGTFSVMAKNDENFELIKSNLKKAESIEVHTGKRLSEGQVYLLFNRLIKTNDHMLENNLMFESAFAALSYYHRRTPLEEGPMDALKKAGSAIAKGAKAVGNKLKPKLDVAKGAIKGAAKQVTTKVTAEKLNKAWKDAGSPTDSDEVYKIIKGLGVGDDVIKGTYDSMQIKPPVGTEEPAEEPTTNEPTTDGSVDTPADPNAPEQGELDLDGTDDAPATNDGPTDPELEKQIGDAKQDAASRKGRGLSPEEEAQIEKEVTNKFEKSKPATTNTDATAEPNAQDNAQPDTDAQDNAQDTTEPATGGSVDTPSAQDDAEQPADEPATTGTEEPKQSTTATIDINKLASDIKKAGKPVVDAVKQKLTA